MIKLPIIHFDCKHFYGDRPCFANKNYGIFCGDCELYEKNSIVAGTFPEIPQPPVEEISEKEKKIIIVKLDAVGDVLRTTSVLPSLKEKYIDSVIVWITKEKSYEVLKDNSMIDEIYFNTDDMERINNDLFDIAINLDSGQESCAIMAQINAKESYGYSLVNGKPYPINLLGNEWYLMGVNDNFKKENKKTYHRIIHEICGLEYKNSQPFLAMPKEKLDRANELKNKFNLQNYNELILINLGGGNRWQYKKWTKEGYIGLINGLTGMSADAAIGIIAGDEDKEFYMEITESIQNKKNIVYFGVDNTVEDFICIVSFADKVFTSDSLGFHIATALNKYVVVVVGPTSNTELDVFDNGKIVFSDKVNCLCCYLNKCDKTITCMNTIAANDIMQIL